MTRVEAVRSAVVRRVLAPAIPYVAVGVGLLVLHNAWLTMLGYHVGMVLVVWLRGAPVPPRRAFRGRGSRIPVLGAVVGLAGGSLLYVLWPLLSLPVSIDSYLLNVGLSRETFPVFIGYFVVVNPLLEEYYWRGFLGSDSRRPVLNDALFAGYHPLVLAGVVALPWLIVIFLALFAGAWFWRQLNRVNGGLAASLVSHISGDLAVMAAAYFLMAAGGVSL